MAPTFDMRILLCHCTLVNTNIGPACSVFLQIQIQIQTLVGLYLIMMLLLQLFDEYRSLLVLAALVLEPDTNDT